MTTTSDYPARLAGLLEGVDPASPLFQRAAPAYAEELEALAPSLRGRLATIRDGDWLLVQLSPETGDWLADHRAEAWEAAHPEPHTLGIDIETYSGAPLADVGVYKYAEAPDFEVLLFGYCVDDGPVRVVDLAGGEKLPEHIREALWSPEVKKTAFNAAFERTCLSRWLGRELPPEQWDCTMVMAARCALPLSLEQCAGALGLPQQKMKEGRALIRKFSVPCRPTKANGGRTRNRPEDDPEAWTVFKRYNRRDVEVEQAIRHRLHGAPVPEEERRLWALDQRINRRGVCIDADLARKAVRMNEEYQKRITEEARALTGLDNPNSVVQLKDWIERRTGRRLAALRKEDLPALAEHAPDDVRRALQIRGELGKTSTTKYATMLACQCDDGRVHGLLQYYGTRTGRWAGRLVQVQNLPQNHLPDLDLARRLVKAGDLDELEDYYGNVPGTLSELIRTAFTASPGNVLTVCDFSAIEARVVAWLAGEKWALDVFRTTGKIYEAAAARMYHVPAETITKTDPRRQKGKIATLALGYEGGTGALAAMGAARMGLSEAEQRQIVTDWRKANPHIVKLWRHLEYAAKDTVRYRRENRAERGLRFGWWRGAMTVRLPSGRTLMYPRARLTEDGRLAFAATDSVTRQWGEAETYGGKLTENVVQAIARDCLAHVMTRIEARGWPIVFHIHDEVVVDYRRPLVQELKDIFATPPDWARDLPLRGDGYATPYYLKD